LPRRGSCGQHSNPCRGIRKFKETKRDRYYTDAEIVAIGKAIAAHEAEGKILPGCAAAIRLAPMTGLRLGELLNLLWTDVDLDAGALEIRDAKAGSRRHPVGAAAVAFLGALTRVGPWVCQGCTPDRRLSTRLLQYDWVSVRTKAELTDARFHDLRHSYGTFAGATKANAFLIRDAMGHKTLAMTGRYVGQDVDPMRELAWLAVESQWRADRQAGHPDCSMEDSIRRKFARLPRRGNGAWRVMYDTGARLVAEFPEKVGALGPDVRFVPGPEGGRHIDVSTVETARKYHRDGAALFPKMHPDRQAQWHEFADIGARPIISAGTKSHRK
jgi:Phage integrase family